MANRWCKGLGEEAKGTDCLGLGLSTLLVSELNISKRLRNSGVWKVYVRGYMKLNQDSAFGREYPSSGLVSLRAWWRSSSGESEYIPYIPKSSLSRREITSISHSRLVGWSSCCIPKQQANEGRKITKTSFCSPLLNCTMAAMSKRMICFCH